MQNINLDISKRLTKLMQDNNLTQRELAETLGVSQTAVYSWCNGIKTPRMDKIDKIAELFNVKRSYILGLDNDMQEKQSWTDKLNNILEEPHETTDFRQLQRVFAYASKILELPADKIKQITDYIDFILSKEDD